MLPALYSSSKEEGDLHSNLDAFGFFFVVFQKIKLD